MGELSHLFATDHVRSIGVWARVPGGGAVEIFITYRPYMDYSSYMESNIFRTAAMLGFRRLQSSHAPLFICSPGFELDPKFCLAR